MFRQQAKGFGGFGIGVALGAASLSSSIWRMT